MILTSESVDEILWCDHSNETSSAVLSHGTIYILAFYKNEIWDWSWILIFGTLGSERVNKLKDRKPQNNGSVLFKITLPVFRNYITLFGTSKNLGYCFQVSPLFLVMEKLPETYGLFSF